MSDLPPDRCDQPGCTGFSCPLCGLCTVVCPNMRCTREAPCLHCARPLHLDPRLGWLDAQNRTNCPEFYRRHTPIERNAT